MWTPLGNRVLILPDKPESETTDFGFKMPEEKKYTGKVVALGSEVTYPIEIGSEIIYSKYIGTEVEQDDKTHIVMRETDLVAVKSK